MGTPFMRGASRQDPFTVSASVALVALVCLWGSFASYGFETAYQRQNSDPYMISQQFVRFEPLLSTVPSAVPEDATLGYLTDASPASTTGLAMTLGAHRVIGNFTRPADFAALGQSYRLRLERDFGNGVVLFRKEH